MTLKISDLDNGERDLKHWEEIANSKEDLAPDRWGGTCLTITGAINTLKAFNARGPWSALTVYRVKDLVLYGGYWYVCVTEHTSGTDFAAEHWRLHQGLTLNDLSDSRASRAIGFIHAGAGAVPRTLEEKIRGMEINITDFGAKSGGYFDNTAAFQYAINEASRVGGKVVVPPGEDWLVAGTITLTGLEGGYAIFGGCPNSAGLTANIIQKNLNVHVFRNEAQALYMQGLSFTVFAGSSKTQSGAVITVLSVSGNTITLSGDPWLGESAVIWNVAEPYRATDGSSYTSLIRFACRGSWMASGAVRNSDGTVTIFGIKGTSGTPDSQLQSVTGSGIHFISLASFVDESSYTNPLSSVILMVVRENPFFHDLWFNQVTRAFAYTELSEGGDGHGGFADSIVIDQARNFIYADGSINALQVTNSQFYAVKHAFKARNNLLSSNFSNCKLFINAGLFDVGGDFVGNTITGSSLNEINGYGYSDGAVRIAGQCIDSLFGANNFGRSRNPVFILNQADGLNLSGNTIISHSENNGDKGFISVAGNMIHSSMAANNFSSKFNSGKNIVLFQDPAADISFSKFGDEVVFRTNHSLLGWQPVTDFLNNWHNILAGTGPAEVFRDNLGIVHFRGVIGGGQVGQPVFNLKPHWRPKEIYNRFVVASADTAQVFSIGSLGEASCTGSQNNWIDLSSITYTAQSTAAGF